MTRRWTLVLGALAAMAVTGCASDWQERYEQSQRENLDIAEQMDEMRSASAAEVAKNEAAEAEKRAMERENQRLLEERNEAARAAKEWQARAEQGGQPRSETPVMGTRQATNSALADIQRTFPDAKEKANGDIEIPLPSDISFASGSDVLNDPGRRALRTLASKLNGEFGSCQIRVEGHTDNEPLVRTKAKYHDNLGLSTARANTVTRFMQEEMRIDPARLVSVGRGEMEPKTENKTAAGRAKNRRVEIKVVMGVQAK